MGQMKERPSSLTEQPTPDSQTELNLLVQPRKDMSVLAIRRSIL